MILIMNNKMDFGLTFGLANIYQRETCPEEKSAAHRTMNFVKDENKVMPVGTLFAICTVLSPLLLKFLPQT